MILPKELRKYSYKPRTTPSVSQTCFSVEGIKTIFPELLWINRLYTTKKGMNWLLPNAGFVSTLLFTEGINLKVVSNHWINFDTLKLTCLHYDSISRDIELWNRKDSPPRMLYRTRLINLHSANHFSVPVFMGVARNYYFFEWESYNKCQVPLYVVKCL